MLFYFPAWHRLLDGMGIAKGGLGPWGSSPIEFRRKLLRIKNYLLCRVYCPTTGLAVYGFISDGSRNFHLGVIAQGACGTAVPHRGQGAKRPLGMEHFTDIVYKFLTAEMIYIRKFTVYFLILN